MNKKLLSLGGLLVLVILFFALNMLFGVWGRGAKVDLTQQSLFTLSAGSRNIARSFDEPINLTLYYSSRLAQGRPAIQTYAIRVREMLEEYARTSGGKIKLKVVDPQPFSDEEDEAVGAGLTGAPINQSETLYFGLVGKNSVDTKEVIPFFDPQAERFLEYDISRTLYSLAHPKRRVIGLITPLPMEGSFFDPMTGQQNRQPPWAVMRELKGFFTVNNLGTTTKEIPKEVDVLMVVHPKNLPDSTLYAIDQYVLKGGKLFVAVDPLCESDQSGADPRNPMAQMMAGKSSTLGKLFDAWGVELVPGKVASDITYATQVVMGSGQRQEPVTYVAWLSMGKTELPDGKSVTPFSADDAITGLLSRMNFATPGCLRLASAKPPESKPAEAKPAESGAAGDKKDSQKQDGDKPAEPAKDATPADAKTGDTKVAEARPAAPAPAEPAPKPPLVLTPMIQTTAQGALLDAGKLQFMPDPKALLAEYVPGNEALTIAARLSLSPGAVLRTAFPEGRPAEKAAPGQPEPPPPANPKEGLVTESAGPVNIIIVADADFMSDRFWIQEQRLGGISLGAAKIADNSEFVVNSLDNLSGSTDLISIRARGEYSRPFDRVQSLAKSAEQQYRAEEKTLEDKIQQTQTRITELQRQRPGDEKSGVLLSKEQQDEMDKLRKDMLDSRKQLRAVQLNLRRDIENLGTRLKVINIALMPIVVACAAVTLGAWRMTRRKSVSFKRDS